MCHHQPGARLGSEGEACRGTQPWDLPGSEKSQQGGGSGGSGWSAAPHSCAPRLRLYRRLSGGHRGGSPASLTHPLLPGILGYHSWCQDRGVPCLARVSPQPRLASRPCVRRLRRHTDEARRELRGCGSGTGSGSSSGSRSSSGSGSAVGKEGEAELVLKPGTCQGCCPLRAWDPDSRASVPHPLSTGGLVE